jgi:hypothetical protein
MKKTIAFLLTVLTVQTIYAQRFDWATSGGYSGIANSFLGAVDIAIDPDGNVYTMDSGNGQQICQGLTAEPYASTTTFIYKFNPEGELQFISRVGAPNGAFNPFNIETDEEGNLYLLGQPNGVTSITINDETVAAVGNTNQLIKMDSNGNLLWKHETGFASNGEGCMLQYHNGFIFYQSDNLTVTKMNADGEVDGQLSATYYSSPTASSGIIFKGSEVFSNGDLMFAAYSRGIIAYGEDTLTNTGNPFLTAPILMIRCTENMELTWARYLSNARDPDQNFIPVAIDSDDNVYASVQVNSEMTIGDDTITGEVSGIGSGTIVKIDENGGDVWAKLIDDTGKAMGWCIAASSDDTGIFVGGGYTTEIQIGSFPLPSAPNVLPFMAKFDGEGNFTNAFNYLSAPSGSGANCLEPIGNGHYMVGGKLPNDTSTPVFSCTPIDAAKGFYLGSFSEQPDQAPIPIITVNGNVITVSPVFNGTIEWYLNGELIPEEISQTLVATVDGNYSVTYSYDTGCVSEQASEVLFVTVTDVSQIDGKPVFNCYPNPAREFVNVTSSSTLPLYLCDATGKVVLQQTLHVAIPNTLNLSHLKSGVYILKQGSTAHLLMKE